MPIKGGSVGTREGLGHWGVLFFIFLCGMKANGKWYLYLHDEFYLLKKTLFTESETPRILRKYLSCSKAMLRGMPLRTPQGPCSHAPHAQSSLLCWLSGLHTGILQQHPHVSEPVSVFYIRTAEKQGISFAGTVWKYQLVFFNCCSMYFTASLRRGAGSLLLPHCIRARFQRAEKIDWDLWLDDRCALSYCQRHEITGDTWYTILKSTHPIISPWPLCSWCHQHAGGLPEILE